MKKLIELQRKIVPEILEIMEKRYFILKEISANFPIGRRALSYKVGLSERVVRTEIDFLKAQNLIVIDASGMMLTDNGNDLLEKLSSFISEIKGITKLEEQLTKCLNIKNVIIVPSEEDDSSGAEMAKAAGKVFLSSLSGQRIIGVTGGTTMQSFASNLPVKKEKSDLIIVPARGGLGEDVEIQANNIAALISKKLNSTYVMLHVPDNIQKGIINSIKSIPDVKSAMQVIDDIDMLVFGIGKADEMARRRKSSKEEIDFILDSGAVSEAFGYYFNIEGDIVYETSTIGISLEKYKALHDIIGIAGGKKKAKAILSIAKINPNLVLVTDESAARYIMDITGGFDKFN